MATNQSPNITVMIKAARKASSKLRRDFGEVEQLQISNKGPGDFVTNADIRTEEILRDTLDYARPGYGFLMEESGEIIGSEVNKRWIIDPIDGTFSFAKGIPLFGTLIGYLYDESPTYGCMRLPKLGNDLLVGDNDSCFLNGISTKCSPFVSWDEALILTTDEKSLAQSSIASNWQMLKKREAQFRTWGDCYGYYLLCTGKADAMLDIDLKPYDILPLIPILKGAGLSIVDFSKKKNYTSILACKPEIKEELSKLLLE